MKMYPHKPLAERIVQAKSKPLSIPTTRFHFHLNPINFGLEMLTRHFL